MEKVITVTGTDDTSTGNTHPDPGATDAGQSMHGMKMKRDDYDAADDQSPFQNSTFNIFDALFVLISIGLLVADQVTDLIVTCKYFSNGDTAWGALTLAFILAPSIILQVFSIRWYLVDDDMSTLKWITHICQVGPLHRYVSLFATGLEARRTRDPVDFERLFYQQSDVCMLRLFESFMESAPQVVLQLYIMVATNDENLWTGASAGISLFSLCWALGAYSRAHCKVRRDKKIVSWPGLVLQTIWRIGMVSSRVMALVLFASVFKAHIFLAVAIHWVGMMIWVHLQKTDFCTNPLEERLFNSVVAVIYVFCFFNLKEGRSRKRVLVFYSIMFVENTALLLVWYHYRTIGEWYNIAGFTIVFGGFGIGVASMILYYRYLHPRNNFHLCGPKPDKKPSRSLETTPSQSPSSSRTALFSPELYRHGHSPSPKQQGRSDINHNDNVDSPLARPLSQCSIHIENGIDKDQGQRSRWVNGEGNLVWRDDSVRKSKSESCVCFNEDETGSAKVHLDASVFTNASLLSSFRCDVSGFGRDLVQRFDNWRDNSIMTASIRSGNVSQFASSVPDHSYVSTSVDLIDPSKGQENALSPDLPQMPDIVDSPNKFMTAYEAQQIYDSILGITHHPRRNSKRKLKFDDDSGRTRSRSGNAVLEGRSTPRGGRCRSVNDASVKRQGINHRSDKAMLGKRLELPPKVTFTSKFVKDGSDIEHACTSGMLQQVGRQLHHFLPATIQGQITSDSGNHMIKTNHAKNTSVESKTQEIDVGNNTMIETKTSAFQDVSADMTRDNDGAKPLQSHEDDHLKRDVRVSASFEDNQNQNIPSIIMADNVSRPSNGHSTGIDIVSPALRAALARDLLKSKERVIKNSQNTNKADILGEGTNKCLPVLGITAENDKEVDASNKLPVIMNPNEHDSNAKNNTDKTSLDSDKHYLMKSDLHDITSQNNNSMPKFVCGNDSKKTIPVCTDNSVSKRDVEQTHLTAQVLGEEIDLSEKIAHKVRSPEKQGTGRLFSSLASKAAMFGGVSGARFSSNPSPLKSRQAGDSTPKFYIGSPSGKVNLKRVRSLKGSVPTDILPHPDESNNVLHSPGSKVSEKIVGNKLEQTPVASLTGKIKRALSIKAKITSNSPTVDSSNSIENHFHDPEDRVGQEEKMNLPSLIHEGTLKNDVKEKLAMAQNVEGASENKLPSQTHGIKLQHNRFPSPKKTPLSQLSVTPLNAKVNENGGLAPVMVQQNTSPLMPSKENAGPLSNTSNKTGTKHISKSIGKRVCSPGKENKGYTPGTVQGVITKHHNGSPVGKKPPRRSLNRIPTNLVADNVARFDSPSK